MMRLSTIAVARCRQPLRSTSVLQRDTSFRVLTTMRLRPEAAQYPERQWAQWCKTQNARLVVTNVPPLAAAEMRRGL